MSQRVGLLACVILTLVAAACAEQKPGTDQVPWACDEAVSRGLDLQRPTAEEALAPIAARMAGEPRLVLDEPARKRFRFVLDDQVTAELTVTQATPGDAWNVADLTQCVPQPRATPGAQAP